MDKFSKVSKEGLNDKKVEEFFYKDNNIEVIHYKDTEFIKEKDQVAILPFFKEEGFFLMKHEYNPTYNYFYKDIQEFKHIDHYLSIITRIVNDNNPKQTIRDELYTNSGIVLSNMYEFDIEYPAFISKNNASRYYISILELKYSDYKETLNRYTDTSVNSKLSNVIKVSLGDIDSIKCHDLLTKYMLMKLKLIYNIK
jgi:hypothetical protein